MVWGYYNTMHCSPYIISAVGKYASSPSINPPFFSFTGNGNLVIGTWIIWKAPFSIGDRFPLNRGWDYLPVDWGVELQFIFHRLVYQDLINIQHISFVHVYACSFYFFPLHKTAIRNTVFLPENCKILNTSEM